MHKTARLLVLVTGLLFLLTTSLALAADVAKATPAPAKAATAAKATPAAKKAQEKCPIMGEPIDKDVFVERNGKRIYLCCKMCTDKVEKDFDKIAAKLESEGIDLTIPKAAAKPAAKKDESKKADPAKAEPKKEEAKPAAAK